MLEMGIPGADEDIGELGPDIGVLISTTRTASMRGFGGSTPNRAGGLAAFHAAPKFALGSDNEVLVKGIGMGGDLHPFAAAGDNRQHG